MFPNRWGFKPRLGSLWLGAHWSDYNKRLCVNIVPCLTIWFVWPGGIGPDDRLTPRQVADAGNHLFKKGRDGGD